ncbi:MAG: hypothetical protein ACLPPF_06970 [Rhodomicrobium sp.]
MKKFIACMVIAMALPLAAQAGERVLDAGLGAAAGGIVFHTWPAALAGGLVGYTAGPGIAQAMGLRGHHRRHYYRRAHR